MGIQLSQKEQELLVLEIVDACLKCSEESQLEFEEVLHEQVFSNNPYIEFMEMVCRTAESLNSRGYIAGTVEIVYETELDEDTFEESPADEIDFYMTSFENISITAKGRAFMGAETFKGLGKNFLGKATPVIKCIASTALQTVIETAIVTGLKAAGFPV